MFNKGCTILSICVTLLISVNSQPAKFQVQSAKQFSSAFFDPAHANETAGQQDSLIASQLSSMVAYPEMLRVRNHGGVVVVRLTLGEAGIIGAVKVFSENDILNAHIISQLTGKRIKRPASTDGPSTYTFKFVFSVNKNT